MSVKCVFRPKLIVFDLDLTLWPFRLDKHTTSPFHLFNRKTIDFKGQEIALFKETVPVLNFLLERGFTMGIASRIEDISGAYQLINLLELSPYLTYREIYPGNKKTHFQSLQRKSGVRFHEMLFFDDDERNIRSVSKLGVLCVHVLNGITLHIVKENLCLEI